MRRAASISECGNFRYWLTRRWHAEGASWRLVNFVMLNPSIADADVDDPTIRRCISFAKAWGYDGLAVTNLYALRATNPADLRTAVDRGFGPENDVALIMAATTPETLVVCAWGAHGSDGSRGDVVRELLERNGVVLHHLGLTKQGEPRHPLYLKADSALTRWNTRAPEKSETND